MPQVFCSQFALNQIFYYEVSNEFIEVNAGLDSQNDPE